MSENTPVSPPAFTDRSAWLVVFGVLHIVMGLFCALMAPMFLLAPALSQSSGSETSWRLALPSLLTYLVLAIVFVWLGVGSVRARRWARVLILVLAWAWLIFGLLTVAIAAMFLPQMLRAAMPETASGLDSIVLVVILVIFSLFLVLLPGAVIVFYRSESVIATCEARDKEAGWTETCPADVLAVSLWTALSGLSMLLVPVAYHGVLPVFGTIVSGIIGSILSIFLAVVWVYAGWAMYRLQPIGWWLTFGSLTLVLVSTIVTFQRVELAELYRAMGFPAEQIQLMGQLGYSSDKMVPLIGALALPFMGYLAYLKKHFR